VKENDIFRSGFEQYSPPCMSKVSDWLKGRYSSYRHAEFTFFFSVRDSNGGRWRQHLCQNFT